MIRETPEEYFDQTRHYRSSSDHAFYALIALLGFAAFIIGVIVITKRSEK